jgi:hypothetical protein
MIITRRRALAFLAAPAVVTAANLMPVRSLERLFPQPVDVPYIGREFTRIGWESNGGWLMQPEGYFDARLDEWFYDQWAPSDRVLA